MRDQTLPDAAPHPFRYELLLLEAMRDLGQWHNLTLDHADMLATDEYLLAVPAVTMLVI